MKKISKYFLVALGLALCFCLKTQPVQAATLSQERTGYWYERSDQNGDNHKSWYHTLYEMDGQVSYCIEPGVPEGTNNYSQASYEATGLPNSIKERIILIGYYGYTYEGHQTLKYRAATQGMIWATILGNGTTVGFSSERWGEGTKLDVSAEMAEIENLIAHHYDRPSFNGGVYKAQVGQPITLTDTNGVLSKYDISVSGAKYSVNGNNLTITPTTSGSIDLTLNKKMPYSSGAKFFVGDGIQNMIVPGTTDPVIAKVRVNSYYGTLSINKSDSETTNAQGQATLKGAKYGIYEKSTGNLVTTIETDENGNAKSNPLLTYQEYYLKEISPSTGYYLDNTRYDFDMREKESFSLNVKEKVIKNYISILKQYDYVDGQTTFLNAEAGITFEIYYPNGNKYGEITTDKNGYATINIPYGVWKLHQVNTTTGYEKIYDFYITVNENSELEQYYNILNNALSAYLQVFKTDKETGKTIAIANTTFKILNTDTKEYVSQYVSGKVYSEFKTDETGKFVTYLKLPAGNYKLIETSSPSGYLLDQDGLNFTIGNNTHYNYTNYGAYVTIYFQNTAIKGKIEIHKSGELFNIGNSSFDYTSTNLKGVVFNIYAEKDIKTSDGNYLYYNAGDLVGTMETDENGYAVSKPLPLGKYYVVEVKTLNDYILDTTEYHIELTEKDNKTAVVYDSLKLTNELMKGTLEFTKLDLVNGEVIPNTLIEVYTENDELIFSGKTDENGKVKIENIKVGKYYILEKEAATGYLISEEKVIFEIKEDGEIVKAEMKDKPITGDLEFTKSDVSTSEALPNTLIEIYNDKDELIYSGRTDENGMITFEELRYGKYYILEKEAPEGYVLNEEKMYFEIKEDGEVVKCNMKDRKIIGTLEFTKLDVSTSEALPNTLIEIYNDKDELVFSGKTDENGQLIVEELEYGKYYILEKEAPEGYVLNEEKMYFEIKEDGEIVKATMVNEKIVVEVPNTGVNDYHIVEIAGSLLIILGIGVIVYVKKKRK